MNQTAVLHATAAVTVGAGFLAPEQLLQLGLFGLGAVLFVAGIVVARRGGDDADPVEGT